MVWSRTPVGLKTHSRADTRCCPEAVEGSRSRDDRLRTGDSRRGLKASLTVVAAVAAIVICAAAVTLFAPNVEAQDKTLFRMEDPKGDDYGPGSYVYPTHKSFEPYSRLFDLTEFVAVKSASTVDFYVTFAEITNPWHAPEGFSHQLVDVYIDCIPRAGRTRPMREGAGVQFSQDFGWDYMVRAMAWGGSRFLKADDPSNSVGIADGVSCTLLPHTTTLKVSVSQSLFDVEISGRWRYYVLVGSQDAFGQDSYRPVYDTAGLWHFGGAEASSGSPNVLDILAPEGGNRSQEAQLRSYDLSTGLPATLWPVGPSTLSLSTVILAIAVLLAFAGITASIVIVRKAKDDEPPIKA